MKRREKGKNFEKGRPFTQQWQNNQGKYTHTNIQKNREINSRRTEDLNIKKSNPKSCSKKEYRELCYWIWEREITFK